MKKINYKLFLKKKKQRISFFGVSPSFDWKFTLFFGVIVFLIGASYISYLYFNILNESLFEVSEDNTEQLLIESQSSQTQAVVESIEDRLRKISPSVPVQDTQESILQDIEEDDQEIFDEQAIN